MWGRRLLFLNLLVSLLAVASTAAAAAVSWPYITAQSIAEDARFGVAFEGEAYNDAFGSAAVALLGTPSTLLLGAPANNVSRGALYIIKGRSSWDNKDAIKPTSRTISTKIQGAAVYDRFGSCIANLGLYNNDSTIDIAVSASGSVGKPNRTASGAVWFLMGPLSQLPTPTIDAPWDLKRDTSKVFLVSNAANRNVQYSNSGEFGSIGDINGDGHPDFIMMSSNSGYRVYIIWGRPTAQFTHIDTALIESGQDTTSGFMIEDLGYSFLTPLSTQQGGDLNGDKIDDLVLGHCQTASYAGVVYVIYGHNETDWDWSSINTVSKLNAALNGSTTGFAIYGTANYEYLGMSCSFLGDVNGDSLGDFGILTNNGYINVIFGRNSSQTPFPTIIPNNSSFFDGVQGFKINAETKALRTLASVDLNNDGIKDIVTSSPAFVVTGQGPNGRVYVVFGHKGAWKANLSLTNFVQGTDGFAIEGQGAAHQFGVVLNSAGDFNGDGIEDLVIGATAAGNYKEGRVYVLYGNTPPKIHLSNFGVRLGTSTVLTYSDSTLVVTDNTDDVDTVTLKVASMKNGYFAYITAQTVAITAFTVAQVKAGSVVIISNNATAAPSFTLTVFDGVLTGNSLDATITLVTASKSSISAGAVVGIVIGCIVAAAVVVAAAVIVVLLFVLKKRSSSSSTTQYGLDKESVEMSTRKTLWSVVLDKSTLLVEPRLLHFDADKTLAPVNKQITQTITVTNPTTESLCFTLHMPSPEPHRFDLKILRAVGCEMVTSDTLSSPSSSPPPTNESEGQQRNLWKIGPQKTITIEFGLTMLCTTVLDTVIKVLEEPKSWCGTRLDLRVESQLSSKLDCDEIKVGPVVGTGAFGTVFRGTWRGQDVAIKQYNQSVVADLSLKSDIDREAEMSSALRHQNIVTFYGTAHGLNAKYYLVMEYVQHGNLSANIRSHKIGEADLKLKTKIALDIATGMAFLHFNRVIHRDLKSDNILLASLNPTSSVAAKLSDFGTSRFVSSMAENRTKTKGVGTPIYMAPEILDGQKYSMPADVYSFAMVVWNLFTCKEPYEDVGSIHAVYKMVLDGKRLPIPPEVPSAIHHVISTAWAPNPDDRPTFSTIASELESVSF